MKPALKPRQFSLLQLVLTTTAVAAYCGFIRYLLISGQGEKILGWIGMSLGIFAWTCMAAMGSWSIFHAIRQIFYWPNSSAVVLRYTIKRSDGQPFYYPVLRFSTASGQTITTISDWRSSRRVWRYGETITIRYNPANAQWAEIATFENIWLMPLAYLMFCLPVPLAIFLAS